INVAVNTLEYRNKNNLYGSLANEGFVFFAEILENVFDGTRSIPMLGVKPNYTGFAQHIQLKLNRLKPETAQIVRGIIKKYKIGSTGQIIMTLLPTLVMYP